ncbi:hypothetical protein NQ315_001335 [Exocentrus adspersus]|uniref:Spaetzle domain-containing protein n=1 Tax=Exocentrus adspersus TaxID=1586481 RepID=A0AAV8WEJ5_9CUCU|nr:hypothetical protein NQ315_001335 [Exocentrus adspersus]
MEPQPRNSVRVFQPKIATDPKCAANATFCEETDLYPYDHFKYILERNATLGKAFDMNQQREEVAQRLNPFEDNFVCKSISRTVFPKAALNKNNKWKFIINQDKYLQGVSVEVCHRENAPCDLIGDIRPGYITYCKQKYIYSKLLSLNDRGNPAVDLFKIPSACCCAYMKQEYDPFVETGPRM